MSGSAEASPVAIIGAGALGSSLARGLVGGGYRVEAVLSRTRDAARTLADQVGAPVGTSAWTALPAGVRLVLVCVPDDAIGDVAEALATLDHPWDDTIVAHTAGAKTAAVLGPLAEQGSATMSFHPMQTFTPNTSPEAFEGIVVGLEGDDRAVVAGETLVHALGARSIRLTPEEKARYHCAAALASNGLVALMAVVEEVFGTDQLDERGAAVDIVEPLLEQTWANLAEGPPEGVLTGPVVRGDEETVQKHLEALRGTTPHLVPLYVALSTEMVRVAIRGGHLSSRQAESLLAILREAADGTADDDPPATLP